MEEEKNCADCKKRAALFTLLGIAAGASLGIVIFKVVNRAK